MGAACLRLGALPCAATTGVPRVNTFASGLPWGCAVASASSSGVFWPLEGGRWVSTEDSSHCHILAKDVFLQACKDSWRSCPSTYRQALEPASRALKGGVLMPTSAPCFTVSTTPIKKRNDRTRTTTGVGDGRMLLALQVRDALLGDWRRYEIGGDGLRQGDMRFGFGGLRGFV